jgi:PAT family beta-lactamase induction signal transducer AmpG
MSEDGLSLGAIGLTANIGLAYTLKFLWSPALDQVAPPGRLAQLGRRRGWLAAIQPCLLLACVLLAVSDPAVAPVGAIAAAALVAFLSASQDIVVDAWRIEIFPQHLQGAAMAAYVWGYRFALLISGAGAIALADRLGWHGSLLAMAGLTGVGIAVTAVAPEPASVARRVGRMAGAIVEPLKDFWARPGALPVMAFVLLYRLGEALAGVMLPPFYRSLGFDRAAVALANGPASLVATLVGIAGGGWLVARLGLGRALVLTSFSQMAAMFMYVALAGAAGDQRMLVSTAMVEAFTEGLTDAAFITYLSGLCNVAYTATQFALLTSLAAVASRTVGGLSGFIAGALGWRLFYTFTATAILPSLLVMLYLVRRYPMEKAE